MNIISAILLLITVLLYIGSIANILTMNASDPAGNGLSQSFAVLIAIALWILIAILLIIGGIKGEMPIWSAVSALLLHPASCAATLAAIRLMSGQLNKTHWPIVIPVLAPALMIAYAGWAYLPSFRAAVPASTASAAVWGTILVLSVAPWPLVTKRSRPTL